MCVQSARKLACAGIHTAWEEAMLKHWAASTVVWLAGIAALSGVLWLCGEGAGAITGQAIAVAGGEV